MDNVVDTIKLEHATVEIYQDEFCDDNPREWDNLGTMVCWHSRYNLGDEKPTSDAYDFIVDLVYDFLSGSDQYEIDSVSGWSDFSPEMLPEDTASRIEKLLDENYIILPLYLYDHSGITMNTSGFSCPWDSGQVGYIYVSKEDVRSEWGWKYFTKQRIEKIKRILRTEVEIYDFYLQNRVYGYSVTCDICGNDLDSCWGFYGENWKENGIMDYVSNCECPCVNRVLFRQELRAEGAGL
jgi:hypothetical protein